MYADRVLTCGDCGQEFTFTASEQEFYADRGFSEPRRCPTCRANRKAQRNAGGGSSAGAGVGSRGGYSSGGYTGGGYTGSSYNSGSSYGGSRGGSYGDRPQREMFEATCSECGRTAKVPFRPTSGKPVYCTDCFARRRA